MNEKKAPDISVVRAVIKTLDSISFPLAMARKCDPVFSTVAGCVGALEEYVAAVEASESTEEGGA